MPRNSCRSKKTGQYIKCRNSAKSCKRGSARRGAVKSSKDCYSHVRDQCSKTSTLTKDSSKEDKLCYVQGPKRWYWVETGLDLNLDEVIPTLMYDQFKYEAVKPWEVCNQATEEDRAVCHIDTALSQGLDRWKIIGPDADSGICYFGDTVKPRAQEVIAKRTAMRGSARH
jgi:hypothetical protein